jgi:hypothetical protein
MSVVVVLHRKFFHTPQLQSLAQNETFLGCFQTSAAGEEEEQPVQEQEAATTTAVEELGYGESVLREWRLSRGHGDHGSVCPEGTSTYSQSHTKLHSPTFFYFLVLPTSSVTNLSQIFTIHSYTMKDTRLGIKGLVDTFTHTISELLFSNNLFCLIVCLFVCLFGNKQFGNY